VQSAILDLLIDDPGLPVYFLSLPHVSFKCLVPVHDLIGATGVWYDGIQGIGVLQSTIYIINKEY